MTTTERQYSKHVGKLFIVSTKRYNHDKKKFQMEHGLCMIYGLLRGGYNGTSGPFNYRVQTITKVEQEYMKDYTVRCREFLNGSWRYYANRNYTELTKENMALVGTVVDIAE